jgi:hypothetical protein
MWVLVFLAQFQFDTCGNESLRTSHNAYFADSEDRNKTLLGFWFDLYSLSHSAITQRLPIPVRPYPTYLDKIFISAQQQQEQAQNVCADVNPNIDTIYQDRLAEDDLIFDYLRTSLTAALGDVHIEYKNANVCRLVDIDMEDLIPPKLATHIAQHIHILVHVEAENEEENECFPTGITPLPHFISRTIVDITDDVQGAPSCMNGSMSQFCSG